MGHLENLEDILLNLPIMPENARDVLGNAIDERDALRARNEALTREVEQYVEWMVRAGGSGIGGLQPAIDRARAALDASTPVAPTEPTWTAGEVTDLIEAWAFKYNTGACFDSGEKMALYRWVLARLAATKGAK